LPPAKKGRCSSNDPYRCNLILLFANLLSGTLLRQSLLHSALVALRQIGLPQLEIRVVVGPSNPYRALLDNAVKEFPCSLTLPTDVRNMPDLMAWADLGVSAGGEPCYELALMKVPLFLITMASSHELTVESLVNRKAAISPGWFTL
jgi:spore coat polysaccharide biosynthesis predicted glycosyltransferase SpsG